MVSPQRMQSYEPSTLDRRQRVELHSAECRLLLVWSLARSRYGSYICSRGNPMLFMKLTAQFRGHGVYKSSLCFLSSCCLFKDGYLAAVGRRKSGCTFDVGLICPSI